MLTTNNDIIHESNIINASCEIVSNGSISLEVSDADNLALSSVYNFQEYRFAKSDNQGDCQDAVNSTAVIDDIFLSHANRHAIGHPLLFNKGERLALLQIAVTVQ